MPSHDHTPNKDVVSSSGVANEVVVSMTETTAAQEGAQTAETSHQATPPAQGAGAAPPGAETALGSVGFKEAPGLAEEGGGNGQVRGGGYGKNVTSSNTKNTNYLKVD